MVAAKPQAAQDVLIFRVGIHACAIVASSVAELVLMPALMQLPGQPAILDGFLNLRGRAVPVASMLQLFHFAPAEPGLHTPLIVIQTTAGPLALRVDSVEEVAAVDYDALLPYSPSDSLNECAEAQFHWNGQEVALLSAERLLLTKERECVAGLQAQADWRLENLRAPSA